MAVDGDAVKDVQAYIRLIGAIMVSLMVCVLFGIVCWALYNREIPYSQKELGFVLMGGLLVAFKDVVQFWTGSTASTQAKDQTIAEMTKKNGTAGH